MTKQDVFDKLDTRYRQQEPHLSDLQEAYRADKGGHAQLLPSHDTLPEDGSERAIDHPLRTVEGDWPSWGTYLDKITVDQHWTQCVRVDTYNAAEGKGYVVVRRVRLTTALDDVGETHTAIKRHDYGPLSRGHEWKREPKVTI